MPTENAARARVPRKRGGADFFLASLPWVWPHALAMGLCQGTMLVPFLLGPLGLGLGAQLLEEPQYTCSFFVAVALSMLANDVVAHRRGTGRGPLAYSLPAMATYVVGVVLLVLHVVCLQGVAAVLVGCAGAVLMGFATACAQLSRARFIATLPTRQGVYIVLAAMLPSAAVVVAAGVLGNPWAGLVLAALPAVGYGFMRFAERRGVGPVGAVDAGAAREVLGTFSLEGASRAGTVAGCAIALGAFVAFASRYELVVLGVPGRLVNPACMAAFLAGLCALVCAVVAATCFKTRTLSMTFVFRMALPCVVAGALLVGLLPPVLESVPGYWAAAFLAAAAMLLIDQMVWVTTAYFMRYDPQISDRTATRFRMLQFFGAAVGAAFSVSGVIDTGVIETMFVGTAALAVAFVVCIPTYEARVVSAGAVAPRLDGLDEEQRRRYSVAFARWGLTAREAEVACLLVEGLDAPGVAERLCVSRATVNTHVRHIYEKMGVHARDEMVAALGQVPGE